AERLSSPPPPPERKAPSAEGVPAAPPVKTPDAAPATPPPDLGVAVPTKPRPAPGTAGLREGRARPSSALQPPPPKPLMSAEVIVEQALDEARRYEKQGKLIEAMKAIERARDGQPVSRQREELERLEAIARQELASYRLQRPK